MAETIYYHPLNPYNPDSFHIPSDLELQDLEQINPPHKNYKSLMNGCPAMSVHQTHTYIIRSPLDFILFYNKEQGKWTEENSSEGRHSLILPSEDKQPYVQLLLFYLFWSEKDTNTKLWQHDPPLYTLDRLPTWYTTSGMIPIGEYTRNTSVGFILKPEEDRIEIKKKDVISSFTFVGNSAIKLIKKKPSHKIIKENIENYSRKKICPYTFSKQLFSKWLK